MYILIYLTLLFVSVSCQNCFHPDALITQNIESGGFHREIKYLIEFSATNTDILNLYNCRVALKQDIPSGMFVNPDQIRDLQRVKKVSAYIDGNVNVESPMHYADPHVAYVYSLNDTFTKIPLKLPVHLRYQRAQISGGYSKVELPKPSLLVHCPQEAVLCNHIDQVEAPCDHIAMNRCVWSNITYKAVTNDIELLVPVGDLDHFPVVSIVTLLVACAGCIYILSILSTTIL